ncbi:hypothetical protein SLEP1_g24515 [Rubroshorea leprosula]|uniref:1,3-beta-glucan synthase component FKS1-like domain-containing protein n=1 Tax=Rubroshorea leprosula TaxID=152421 RepID=A0AAV5JS15_9ROSI|nr:hypothetical protein SLEP1_g24515 [Rubroshorea leprosula]
MNPSAWVRCEPRLLGLSWVPRFAMNPGAWVRREPTSWVHCEPRLLGSLRTQASGFIANPGFWVHCEPRLLGSSWVPGFAMNLGAWLNKILDNCIDDYTRMPFVPSSSVDCGFLKNIMMLFYETIRKEVEDNQNRTASHFAWRNYDDINEYFSSKRCFRSLKWPIDM